MLARWRETCFISARLARSKVNWFRATVHILAGVLLILELLAANGGFHQALHHTGNAPPDSCALCLIAKGQVGSPEPALISTQPIQFSFHSTPQIESIVLMDFSYLTPPGRAPPALASFSRP